VFADNTAGVRIFGGDTNTITGNYFSTKPDGTLGAGLQNATDIRITDDGIGPDQATGNVVGGADTATPTGRSASATATSPLAGRWRSIATTSRAATAISSPASTPPTPS
jgi:hypothetical protein